MTTAEKVAYLKGLTEGYGIDPAAKEGKILSTILEILEDLALDVEDLEDEVADLDEGLDAVSEDLADVENVLYDDLDVLDDDLDDEDEDEDEDDGLLFYETECPVCGEIISLDEDAIERPNIQCPACGASLHLTGEEEPEENDGE
ncbi:MAG: hypothetical protein LUG57_06545 [Oscillospiraceae bacterium]|nr:hypothetical protein [Oscillospiraceae bacterium]